MLSAVGRVRAAAIVLPNGLIEPTLYPNCARAGNRARRPPLPGTALVSRAADRRAAGDNGPRRGDNVLRGSNNHSCWIRRPVVDENLTILIRCGKRHALGYVEGQTWLANTGPMRLAVQLSGAMVYPDALRMRSTRRHEDRSGEASPAAPSDVERWLDVLIETSPFAMAIICSTANRCVRANQALADLYGIPVAEILNSDPFSLALRVTHPDDLVREQSLFAELVAGTRRAYTLEKRYVRPDGSVRWGQLTFSAGYEDPTAAHGALRFAVAQVLDVQDKKCLEETLRRREEELRHAQKIDGIGRLAAGVAHDFNNLLTVITGHGALMQRHLEQTDGAGKHEPSQPDALRVGLSAILDASERAASLTAQLLAFGRRAPVNKRTFKLSTEVATLDRLLARTLGPNVALDRSLDATGSVFADSGQIGQVVMNLLLNARDATADGGRIQLRTRDVLAGERDAREWVALSVADTGHGMSPEVHARMFEPFFTTRQERPGTQGTGLGLSTSQRIVTDLGGRIEVESAVGVGTTVTVMLPRVADVSRAANEPLPAARPRVAPNSQRILVVDDDPPVRSLIGTVLLGAHYWVVVACDAEEALRFVDEAKQPFDLVVTDLLMPGVSGGELARRLRDRGQRPRMLFVSGYAPIAEDLRGYGEVLQKPFAPNELLAAVSRAFEPR